MRTINLIPQEGKAASDARNRLFIVLALGLIYVLLLGVVTVWRQGAVTDAEAELQDQQQINQDLRLQVNTLGGAEAARDEFDSGVALLAGVLISDVSWGRLLNDMGRLIPDRVWISNYAGLTNRLVGGGDPTAGVGELSFTGTAFAPPDVAAWLRVLDSDRYPGVVGTWASSITASEIAGAEVVTFGSTTSLTADALSGRIFERIPEIP
jgi:Tfp pilus assembly protein PilN